MSQSGKGDKRRPVLVSEKKVQSNWDKTYGKKEKKNEKQADINLVDNSTSR